MRTRRKKHSRLWVYLLYLGLVTSLILSVTLAKYASSASGTGTATVAAMAGSVEGKPISMLLDNLRPGGEARTLDFQVVNYSGDAISEVALDYEIKVETTGNLPLTFALSADGTENVVQTGPVLQDSTVGENGTAEQVLSGGAFPLTGEKQAHAYTLTVTWPEEKNDAGYADEIDLVTVTVTARQRLAGEPSTDV